jgi:hypothetical protein
VVGLPGNPRWYGTVVWWPTRGLGRLDQRRQPNGQKATVDFGLHLGVKSDPQLRRSGDGDWTSRFYLEMNWRMRLRPEIQLTNQGTGRGTRSGAEERQGWWLDLDRHHQPSFSRGDSSPQI